MRTQITGEGLSTRLDIEKWIWQLMQNGMSIWLKDIELHGSLSKKHEGETMNMTKHNIKNQTAAYSMEIISIFTDMALGNLAGELTHV